MIHTVFFGTHNLAATVLTALLDAQDITVDLVITQPDRPVGRKKIMTPPPVKVLAEQHDIPVDQPESLTDYDRSKFANYQVALLTEYGIMVPEDVINAFPKGILNVHYSLLPKYRGATPIQSAIRNGDAETGVSIMMLEKAMDTGPVLAQAPYALDSNEMHEKTRMALATLGANLLVDTLPKYLDGSTTPAPQDDSAATLCSQLTRDDGRVDWSQTALQIYNQYRAFTPWPGVWTTWNTSASLSTSSKRLKLLNISVSDVQIHAGSVVVEDGTLYVGTSEGSIKIYELQLEGKSAMDSKTFVNGLNDTNNIIFS